MSEQKINFETTILFLLNFFLFCFVFHFFETEFLFVGLENYILNSLFSSSLLCLASFIFVS